jgi:hypothetical protein
MGYNEIVAIKKVKAKVSEKPEEVVEEVRAFSKEKKCVRESKWLTASWMVLLIAGLGHMMPTQLAPVLGWGMYGITLQMVVGVLSVVAALYYLLEE